jgi:hypothetical protein
MENTTYDDLFCYKAQMQPPLRVVLCGSTRFMQAFQEANLRETLAGNIVLTIGCDTKSDEGLHLTETDKFNLDLLHLHKIDLADEMLILNVGGYIGASTRRELIYGARFCKKMRFLEPEHLFTNVCSFCGRLYRWVSDDAAWLYEASAFAPCGCLWQWVLRLNLVQGWEA